MTFKTPSLELQDEVNRARANVLMYRGIAFLLGAMSLVLAGSIVYVMILVPRILVFCLVPPMITAWILWLQSQHTRRFVNNILGIQSNSYVLYLRGSDADSDPTELNFENALVQAIEPIGPLVIVDEQSWYRRSAAIRLRPFPPDVYWTEKVGILADNARLVVIWLRPRRGYRPRTGTIDDRIYDREILDGVWLELELMPKERFKGKCLIFIGNYWDNRQLQCTNANGSLNLGTTTLINEIRNFVPREASDYWPKFRSSRWIWFDPSGRPRPLGPPYSGSNTSHQIRRELSEIIAFYEEGVFKRTFPLFEAFLLIGLTYTLIMTLVPILVIFSTSLPALIGLGIITLLFLTWLYRENIKTVYYLLYYGAYENFVWPVYMYSERKSRPKRRSSDAI